MLQNYFKTASRNLLRNKVYAAINIVGLAAGIAACILIFLYVKDEVSYDRYNTKADRIYRVTRDFLSNDGTVSLSLGHVAPPFGPLLKQEFRTFRRWPARSTPRCCWKTKPRKSALTRSMYTLPSRISLRSSLFQ